LTSGVNRVWRNRMSFDKHCFEPYTHFVVWVTLIPGP